MPTNCRLTNEYRLCGIHCRPLLLHPWNSLLEMIIRRSTEWEIDSTSTTSHALELEISFYVTPPWRHMNRRLAVSSIWQIRVNLPYMGMYKSEKWRTGLVAAIYKEYSGRKSMRFRWYANKTSSQSEQSMAHYPRCTGWSAASQHDVISYKLSHPPCGATWGTCGALAEIHKTTLWQVPRTKARRSVELMGCVKIPSPRQVIFGPYSQIYTSNQTKSSHIGDWWQRHTEQHRGFSGADTFYAGLSLGVDMHLSSNNTLSLSNVIQTHQGEISSIIWVELVYAKGRRLLRVM